MVRKPKGKIVLSHILLLVLLFGAGCAGHHTVYVSLDGHPEAPGSREKPLSLSAALTLANEGKCSEILINDGTYLIDSGMTLSGVRNLTIRPVNPGKALFSSGRPVDTRPIDTPGDSRTVEIDLTGWVHDTLPWPHTFRGYAGWPEVFVNGVAMELARWPDSGYLRPERITDPGSTPRNDSLDRRGGSFVFSEINPANWDNEQEIFLGGYWCYKWYDEYIRVADIDPVKKEIQLAAPHLYGIGGPSGALYFALNVKEELNRPGEYYYNRSESKITLIMPDSAGTSPDIKVTWSPFTMLEIKNSHDVTLEDLVFSMHTGKGIQIDSCTNVTLNRCTLRDISSEALIINGGRECGADNCGIFNIGKTAVSLSGGNRRNLEPAGHFVRYCNIHHFARYIKTYNPGILVSGVGQYVGFNHIHDAPHNAILFSGNDHVIDSNRIEDVCLDTSDAGAIYCGRDWTLGGTVIRNNYFTALGEAVHHFNWAIYLDDLASGIEVSGNTIENTSSGILIGGGRYNSIIGNMIRNCPRESIMFDARGMNWYAPYLKDTAYSQWTRLREIDATIPPWSARFPWLKEIREDNPEIPKHNVILNNQLVNSASPEIHPTVIEFGDTDLKQ